MANPAPVRLQFEPAAADETCVSSRTLPRVVALTGVLTVLLSVPALSGWAAPMAPAAAPAASVASSVQATMAPRQAASPAPAATPAPAAQPAEQAAPSAQPSAEPATSAPVQVASDRAAAASVPSGRSAGRRIVIDRYTVALGSQAAIDDCKLVLYWDQPLWFAAHNYCGYQWMANVPVGTTIVVRSGRAAGTYRVTDHARLNRQSGSLPRFDADLVLQTCMGSGTGFSLATRVG